MKRAIVFDSSTLILLAKISLLRDIADRAKCIITNIVEEECTAKDTFDAKIIKGLVTSKLIETVRANPDELAKMKNDFNMQEGEASSMALAIKENGILATDDKPTIKACIILNVEFSTAVHFVVRAYKRGLINREEALEKLVNLAKYGRYDARIIEDAKSRIDG